MTQPACWRRHVFCASSRMGNVDARAQTLRRRQECMRRRRPQRRRNPPFACPLSQASLRPRPHCDGPSVDELGPISRTPSFSLRFPPGRFDLIANLIFHPGARRIAPSLLSRSCSLFGVRVGFSRFATSAVSASKEPSASISLMNHVCNEIQSNALCHRQEYLL